MLQHPITTTCGPPQKETGTQTAITSWCSSVYEQSTERFTASLEQFLSTCPQSGLMYRSSLEHMSHPIRHCCWGPIHMHHFITLHRKQIDYSVWANQTERGGWSCITLRNITQKLCNNNYTQPPTTGVPHGTLTAPPLLGGEGVGERSSSSFITLMHL